MSLSERLRGWSECAPWVVAEVHHLEAELAAAREALGIEPNESLAHAISAAKEHHEYTVTVQKEAVAELAKLRALCAEAARMAKSCAWVNCEKDRWNVIAAAGRGEGTK